MAQQLTFDLPSQPAFGAEAFFVAPPNALAVKAINNWQDWPQNRLLLVGPEGSGKTHLVKVWQALTGARLVDPQCASTIEGPCAVDPVDTKPRDPDFEEACFHAINSANGSQSPMLLTATTVPGGATVALPDLLSRLTATQIIHLQQPDDALLAATMIKQFGDRQLRVPPNLISYIVPRIERSFAAASQIVSHLDAVSMSTGKPVTRTMARHILDRFAAINDSAV